MVTGIKAPYQATYDSCYGLHGSNGTYVENANPEWVLKFRLRRLDFAVNESVSNQINIHQYITQNWCLALTGVKSQQGDLNSLTMP